MGFTKIRDGNEELFITIVKDEMGNEIDKWKVLKRDYKKVVRLLNTKYGLNLVVIDKKKPKKEKDLDWAI